MSRTTRVPRRARPVSRSASTVESAPLFPPIHLQDGKSPEWTCQICGRDALWCKCQTAMVMMTPYDANVTEAPVPQPAPASQALEDDDDSLYDGWTPEFTVWIVRRGSRFPMMIDTIWMDEEPAQKRAKLLCRGEGWKAAKYSHIRPKSDQRAAKGVIHAPPVSPASDRGLQMEPPPSVGEGSRETLSTPQPTQRVHETWRGDSERNIHVGVDRDGHGESAQSPTQAEVVTPVRVRAEQHIANIERMLSTGPPSFVIIMLRSLLEDELRDWRDLLVALDEQTARTREQTTFGLQFNEAYIRQRTRAIAAEADLTTLRAQIAPLRDAVKLFHYVMKMTGGTLTVETKFNPQYEHFIARIVRAALDLIALLPPPAQET